MRRSNWYTAAITGFLAGSALTALTLRPPTGPHADATEDTSAQNNLQMQPEALVVHALGRLEPAGRILQIVPEAGNDGATIQELLIAEGDNVSSGQILAVLGTLPLLEARCREAESAVELARAELQQFTAGAKSGEIAAAEATIQKLSIQLRSSERDLDRAKQLISRQAISSEELEISRTRRDSLEADCRQAEAELDALRDIRQSDLAVFESRLKTAITSLESAQATAATARVRSPVDGRILRIHTQPGERFNGSAILEIGNVAEMHAVAEVFEGDVPRVSTGDTALVRLDASDIEVAGQVVHVGQLVSRKVVLTNDPVSDTDARVVEVRIALTPESSATVSGLSNSRVEVFITPRSTPPGETFLPAQDLSTSAGHHAADAERLALQ